MGSTCPELTFVAKESVRRTAAPTRGGLAGLKRIGPYLAHRPRLAQVTRYPGEFLDEEPRPAGYPGELWAKKRPWGG